MLGFLRVDDRDRRVLGEFIGPLEALRAIDLLELEEPELARALRLVRFDRRQGAAIGTQTTTRIASLS